MLLLFLNLWMTLTLASLFLKKKTFAFFFAQQRIQFLSSQNTFLGLLTNKTSFCFSNTIISVGFYFSIQFQSVLFNLICFFLFKTDFRISYKQFLSKIIIAYRSDQKNLYLSLSRANRISTTKNGPFQVFSPQKYQTFFFQIIL